MPNRIRLTVTASRGAVVASAVLPSSSAASVLDDAPSALPVLPFPNVAHAVAAVEAGASLVIPLTDGSTLTAHLEPTPASDYLAASSHRPLVRMTRTASGARTWALSHDGRTWERVTAATVAAARVTGAVDVDTADELHAVLRGLNADGRRATWQDDERNARANRAARQAAASGADAVAVEAARSAAWADELEADPFTAAERDAYVNGRTPASRVVVPDASGRSVHGVHVPLADARQLVAELVDAPARPYGSAARAQLVADLDADAARYSLRAVDADGTRHEPRRGCSYVAAVAALVVLGVDAAEAAGGVAVVTRATAARIRLELGGYVLVTRDDDDTAAPADALAYLDERVRDARAADELQAAEALARRNRADDELQGEAADGLRGLSAQLRAAVVGGQLDELDAQADELADASATSWARMADLAQLAQADADELASLADLDDAQAAQRAADDAADRAAQVADELQAQAAVAVVLADLAGVEAGRPSTTSTSARHPFRIRQGDLVGLGLAHVNSDAWQAFTAALEAAATADGHELGAWDAEHGTHDAEPLSGQWADAPTPRTLLAEALATVADDTAGAYGLAAARVRAQLRQLVTRRDDDAAELAELVADAWEAAYLSHGADDDER